MAIINKKDFSIMDHVLMSKFIDNNDYFECDDLIAPAIALLNKKGYRTKFCCSGHPYPSIESYMTECMTHDAIMNSIDYFKADKIRDRLLNEFGYTEKDLNKLKLNELYCVVFKNEYYPKLYVVFEERYEFPNLPDIFYIDETNGGIYQHYQLDENEEPIPDSLETFEGMTLVYDTNRIFYEYVKNLKSLI